MARPEQPFAVVITLAIIYAARYDLNSCVVIRRADCISPSDKSASWLGICWEERCSSK